MRMLAMRPIGFLLVAGIALLPACGGGSDAGDVTTTASVTEATASTSSTTAPYVSTSSTTAPDATSSSVMTVPVTTTTVQSDDQRPSVDPEWPDFRPYEDIPWDDIASGTWVLYQYEVAEHRGAAADLWWNALFLLSPDGISYAVRSPELDPSPRTLFGWLPSRQLALLKTWTSSGGSLIEVVDLRTGAVVHATEGDPSYHAPRFVDSDGSYAVLYESGQMDVHSLSGDTTSFSIGDTTHEGTAAQTGFVAFIEKGLLVTSSSDIIAVRSLDGTVLDTFEPPGLDCYLTGTVDGAALISCSGADYMEQCQAAWGTDGHRGVWMLPVDGGEAEAIYVPPVGTDLDPESECWIGAFSSAIPIPGQPGDYVLEMSGCCECGGGLALLRDGVVSEVRGTPPWCEPYVVTRWGDGWLILDSATDDGTHRPSLIVVDEDLRNAVVLVGIEAGAPASQLANLVLMAEAAQDGEWEQLLADLEAGQSVG
ncbi:MAG: hypothetical protein R6W79_06355, partial [Acidimicrobiia bacterium]